MITFRADEETEKMLTKAARQSKKTKTEILKEALQMYLAGTRPAGRKRRQSVPQAIRESIGVWDGPADLSIGTGRRFGDLLSESKRARRV
jgi:hypothetical protein